MARQDPARPHPKTVGDRTTAHVLVALLDVYKCVLVPFGDNQKYDLLVEREGAFTRVQCKTGRLRNGAIRFNTCSVDYHHPSNRGTKPYRHHYRGVADFFGVYCPDTGAVYLVPVDEVGLRIGYLRVDLSKNNQRKKVRWAKEYEVKTPG
jgi:hypothetical protein